MAKIFTKLNIGDTIATSGIRVFKKLVLEVSKVHTFAQFICTLMGFSRVNVDYPVPNQMSTDGQLGVKGTPNAQNVDNIIVTTGEFGSNVTTEEADGINRTGIAEMKFVVCGRPTNGSIEYTRATDEWALGLFGSADYANTVERSGETTVSIETKVMPTEQEMTTMLFSAKGELNGTATPEEAEVAEQVSPHVSAELNMTAQPNVKNMYDVIFVVNGKVEHPTSVLEGEAPSDPVADGTIDKPTKESTAQYHFHYAGWSKTEDGEPIGGSSGEIVILEETTYDGFEDGAYYISPAPFVLTEGKTYQVIWDGTEHTCVCIIDPDSGLPVISDLVLDENYSPINGTFTIAYGSPEFTGAEDDAMMMVAYDLSSEDFFDIVNTSHTVAIKELAKIEILPKTTYSDFIRHTVIGRYVQYDHSLSFAPVVGETYIVVWDGKTFTCTAQDGSSFVEGATFIGNAADLELGLSGNKEPFIIGGTPDSPMNIFALNDTEATEHTVAIYQQSASGSKGLPVITEDTTFYAVYDKELRHYTASFYVNGELQGTQTVAYGETATPPEITGEAGMVLQWSTEDFTITGDTDFYGVWVKDYILSGEFTFTYNESYHAYFSTTSAKQQLSAGGTYVVEWGDKVFSCVARDVSGSVASKPKPTNLTLADVIGSTHNVPYVFNLPATWDDSQSNNEPFCIQTYLQGTNIKVNIFTIENVGTISVNVYAKQ